MDRNYLANRHGIHNAILAAVGYNFRRLIRWLRNLIVPYPRSALPVAKTSARLKKAILHRRLAEMRNGDVH